MSAPIQTTLKEGPVIPDLKPSMPRAPRKKPKRDILKSPASIAGVDYEVYDSTKHNK